MFVARTHHLMKRHRRARHHAEPVKQHKSLGHSLCHSVHDLQLLLEFCDVALEVFHEVSSLVEVVDDPCLICVINLLHDLHNVCVAFLQLLQGLACVGVDLRNVPDTITCETKMCSDFSYFSDFLRLFPKKV